MPSLDGFILLRHVLCAVLHIGPQWQYIPLIALQQKERGIDMAVIYTQAEQRQLTDEGVRVTMAGEVTSISRAFVLAQSVLPKNRRRTVTTTAKVPWFVAAIKAAKEASNGPQSDERQLVATSPPPPPKNASEAVSGRRVIHWKGPEKRDLSSTAFGLLSSLQANSPRDALNKAQLLVLPPERRRPNIASMTSVADWYPDGLKAAKAAAEKAAARRAAEAVEAVEAPTPPAAQPLVSVEPAATVPTAPTTTPALASLFGDWTHVREHLVQVIASIVAEGIHRGLASVQLSAPAGEDVTPTRHVPFVVDPNPKIRPPSVLVAGLKDATASQIKAEFGSRLDLRFITPDKSKDQLRLMAEQADTTIAVTDFLSHSHTDIIKARSKHHVECSGGMTSLRQHLANLAGLHLNGSASATGPA